MALVLTDPVVNGDVTTYTASSTHNPQGTVFRILRPTTPAPGVPHRLLLVLPVKPGTNTDFGDGLDTIVADALHQTYHMTCVAPTFPTEPWIGDHPTTANRRYESFLVLEVLPWCAAHLPVYTEVWVLSFSKGAYGAVTLWGRYPAIFTGIGAWDCPAQIPWTTGPEWEMEDAYGSEANWIATYQVASHASTWAAAQTGLPATSYLSGDTSVYQAQTVWLRDQWLAQDLRFWFKSGDTRAHRWDTGWVPETLAALHAMAVARTTLFLGQPAQVPGRIDPHPFTQQLELALIFHPQNGTVVSQSGRASGVTSATTVTPLSFLERTTVPTELYQTAGMGLLFGSGCTALDQVDKTLLVWCRPTSVTVDQGLISKDYDFNSGNDGGWGFILTAEGRLCLYVDATHRQTDHGAVALVAGEDVCLGVTFQASTGLARFYINGVFTSAVVDATAVETPSPPAALNLGGIRDNSAMLFTGRFRQVRGYSRCLSDAEMADLAVEPFLGFQLVAVDQTDALEAFLRFPPEVRSCQAAFTHLAVQYLHLP